MARFNQFAKGRIPRRVAGQMSSTEVKYASLLEARQTKGEIIWYKYEGLKFRLADKTFYTPDFVIQLPNGELEVHEVKGFWLDAARIKIKVAADTYPFKFIAITYKKKEWVIEEF